MFGFPQNVTVCETVTFTMLLICIRLDHAGSSRQSSGPVVDWEWVCPLFSALDACCVSFSVSLVPRFKPITQCYFCSDDSGGAEVGSKNIQCRNVEVTASLEQHQ